MFNDLLAVARRVVWFQNPEETLKDEEFFLAYLMTYGTLEDVITAKKYYSDKLFLKTLKHAPPGVFDARSWSYWNTVFNRTPIPSMPHRKL